jgi:hypothetical protein
MAIIIETSQAADLLEKIKSAIVGGEIVTWAYDDDDDFTHTAKQWEYEAWLRPSIGKDRLTFYIVPPTTKVISTEIYAIYHGRFIESILAHFDSEFVQAYATAMPKGRDQTRGSKVPPK